MVKLRNTVLAVGLAALVSAPVFAGDETQVCTSSVLPPGVKPLGDNSPVICEEDARKSEPYSVPEPSSCNGQLGFYRQARIVDEGITGAGQHFRVHLDCKEEPAAWTFLTFYDGITGYPLGTMGTNGDSAGFTVVPTNTLDAMIVVTAYDYFDPVTGTYGNMLGQDSLERFRNLYNLPAAQDTDGGDFPHIPGWTHLEDWMGVEDWPDFAEHDDPSFTHMAEMYLVGAGHIMDRTYCDAVFVNGLPYTGSGENYPAVCSTIFVDGFESGDTGAWD